jgi:hypothetical protein
VSQEIAIPEQAAIRCRACGTTISCESIDATAEANGVRACNIVAMTVAASAGAMEAGLRAPHCQNPAGCNEKAAGFPAASSFIA